MGKSANLQEWQAKLLPFMVRMVISLTLFFFLASCIQLIYLHLSILKVPVLNIGESLSRLSMKSDANFDDVLKAEKLNAIIRLEAHSLQRHYHQANVLLMSRVWIRYLGFVTGMILSLVGAAFILGKLQIPTSELNAKANLVELSFRSASPGLILTILGVTLMLTTIITHHNIETTDSAVYLRNFQPTMAIQNEEKPQLQLPKQKNADKEGR